MGGLILKKMKGRPKSSYWGMFTKLLVDRMPLLQTLQKKVMVLKKNPYMLKLVLKNALLQVILATKYSNQR